MQPFRSGVTAKHRPTTSSAGVATEKTEDVIAAALTQAGETGMTRTEIRDLFGRHRKGHEIDAALAMLAGRGKAKCIMGDTRGGRRPTVRSKAFRSTNLAARYKLNHKAGTK